MGYGLAAVIAPVYGDFVNPEHYQLVETRLQERLPDGTTRCNLCRWQCRIGHGQRGFCQAHVNRHGTLYNLSYGIISALETGPIEAKPVRHFRPGTQIMSVGSFGCNFRCGGCHNLDISWGVDALDALAQGESNAAFVTAEELVAAALSHGVEGIAFTYSEPAVWLEYVLDVSKAAREAGLYTVYVTNSFITDEALELMAPWVDVLCSDIKSLNADFYKSICRPAMVEDVLACIEKAQALGIHVETRTNIIPGYNDEPDMIAEIARWVHDHLGADSPWHVTRFFPAFKMSHVAATPVEMLERAGELGKAQGLKNVYVYADQGCDCAKENLPPEVYLGREAAELYETKKCSASCCGDEGVLLKKFEEGL